MFTNQLIIAGGPAWQQSALLAAELFRLEIQVHGEILRRARSQPNSPSISPQLHGHLSGTFALVKAWESVYTAPYPRLIQEGFTLGCGLLGASPELARILLAAPTIWQKRFPQVIQKLSVWQAIETLRAVEQTQSVTVQCVHGERIHVAVDPFYNHWERTIQHRFELISKLAGKPLVPTPDQIHQLALHLSARSAMTVGFLDVLGTHPMEGLLLTALVSPDQEPERDVIWDSMFREQDVHQLLRGAGMVEQGGGGQDKLDLLYEFYESVEKLKNTDILFAQRPGAYHKAKGYLRLSLGGMVRDATAAERMVRAINLAAALETSDVVPSLDGSDTETSDDDSLDPNDDPEAAKDVARFKSGCRNDADSSSSVYRTMTNARIRAARQTPLNKEQVLTILELSRRGFDKLVKRGGLPEEPLGGYTRADVESMKKLLRPSGHSQREVAAILGKKIGQAPETCRKFLQRHKAQIPPDVAGNMYSDAMVRRAYELMEARMRHKH